MSANTGLRFFDFWPNFRTEKNIFQFLSKGLEVNSRIDIYSVYPRAIKRLYRRLTERFVGKSLSLDSTNLKTYRPRKQTKIWYTAENIRPPFGKDFDFYLSFDQDSFGGKNIYFPLFYSELIFRSEDPERESGIHVFEPEVLTKPRNASIDRPGFVCAFINNPEPQRLRAIKELSKYGQVDVFGKLTGNPVPTKFEVAKNYKYMLCFENDLYPGYVTEKLLDAYVCGTVPLYWGLLGNEPYINRDSFINAADFQSISDFASHVSNLSDQEFRAVQCAPLLKAVPSLQVARKILEEALKTS